MLQTINNEIYGEISYEESFWTGKKIIKINGVQLTKIKGRIFSYQKDGKSINVEVKGSFLTGVKLLIEGNEILLMPSPKWYEYLIVIAGFMFNVIWSNVVTLCEIVPIVGGAIGGALYALAGLCALIIGKNVKKPILKILVCLGFTVAGFVVGFFIAFAIICASLL